MAIDYKEKIRKLLALAESPVEAEAKAALLKARQLMAEHKLTEIDVKAAEKQAVKDILTDITCSKRRDSWIVKLSGVIGENYCCKNYSRRYKGQQTRTIGFIGFEDDVEICIGIFKYAVDCIHAGVQRIKKENESYSSNYIKNLYDSYGYGFVNGISAAFAAQQEKNKEEWGLVLAVPKEVKEASQHLVSLYFKARIQDAILPDGYARGYSEGKEFDPTRRLQR